MKAFITAVALAATCGVAFAADPVAKRTPNGGMEYYTNTMIGQGSQETGCYLPWQYAGFHTTGWNPKRIEMGEATVFFDCKIAAPVALKVVAPAPMPAPMPAPAPAPMPKAEAPVAAPMPAPAPMPKAEAPMPTAKKIRE